MEVQFKFSNGQIVKDRVSGITGIIDQSTIMDTGNIQYSLQPQSTDGKKQHDSWFVDEASLEIEEGKTPIQKTHVFKFDPGTKVKNKITEFEGYITRAILDYGKCVRYTITGKYNYEKGSPNVDFADGKHLESIAAPPLKTNRSETGCASTRSTPNQH